MTNMLYTGEQFDTDAQQYYLRARYYNPLNGRFNRMDPYAGNTHDPQSLHKYLYCHANPVNAADPTGMFGIGVAIASINMLIFRTIEIGVKCLPALAFANSIAWSATFASFIVLILEAAGVIPESGYMDKIFAISLTAATFGTVAYFGLESFRGMVQPISGSRGRIDTASVSNEDSMVRHGYSNPPYKNGTLTVEGKGAPGARLVRFVSGRGIDNPRGDWVAEWSEVEGLPAPMIQNKLSMPTPPTHYSNVDAVGIQQRWGVAGANYGCDGGGIQGELLQSGARFSTPKPIPTGGLSIGGPD
jgi:RHS repeat-associated protein